MAVLTEAERDAREQLEAAYARFTTERDSGRKEQAAHDLIRSIFGEDAIAEDSVR